jgi:Bacterial capsule synthesis protein PGA_cap
MAAEDLVIAFCGDVMMGAEVAQYIGTSSIKEWLSGVSEAWSHADLVIGNLECPCVVDSKPVDGPQSELIFHAPASRLKELADAGFTALTLANNHILNCGPLGLFETIRGLNDIGLYHAGAGMNLTEALQPAFIPVKGQIVALVAFCYGPQAGVHTAGAAPSDPKFMRKALATARANADLVIAALHDGLEYSDVPPSNVRGRFRFLASNGADIVIGHHPHVLQGLEWYQDVPIAYSLGDLLFHNSLPHVATRNFDRIAMGLYAPQEIRRDPDKFARGALLIMRLSGGRKSVQWRPFRQRHDLRPELSEGAEKAEALRRLDDLSTALLAPSDPRHGLADAVVARARREHLAALKMRDVIRLVLRPRWRYLWQGIIWIYHALRGGFRLLS